MSYFSLQYKTIPPFSCSFVRQDKPEDGVLTSICHRLDLETRSIQRVGSE
jgi:hypothetical protein